MFSSFNAFFTNGVNGIGTLHWPKSPTLQEVQEMMNIVRFVVQNMMGKVNLN